MQDGEVRKREGTAQRGATSIVWVNGWVPQRTRFVLEMVHGSGSRWSRSQAPLDWALGAAVFDVHAAAFSGLEMGNVRLNAVELGRLSRLIEPGEIFPRPLAALRQTRHDIFVWENEGARIYLPALLLLQLLWLRSTQAARALLQPSSVNTLIVRAQSDRSVHVCGRLLSPHRPASELRRAAWLGQADDARRSWGSLLGNARAGRLSLSLPAATLGAWAWGIQLPSGFLCSELKAVKLDYRLPAPDHMLRTGRSRTAIPIPNEPAPPQGFIRLI